jgi:hypothetical protein
MIPELSTKGFGFGFEKNTAGIVVVKAAIEVALFSMFNLYNAGT